MVQENKHELQQLGERLARASHESKASDIEHKLSKVSERWQHLLDLIGARYCNTHHDVVGIISTISHNIYSKFILKSAYCLDYISSCLIFIFPFFILNLV